MSDDLKAFLGVFLGVFLAAPVIYFLLVVVMSF